MLSQMKHCALLVMIPPDQEEKLVTASHLEEEMKIESFRLSVSFSTQEAALSHQKPVKHFYGFSSRRGHFLRLQKSHRKKK